VNGYRFQAMGCEVVLGGGSPTDHRAIEDLFLERERVFSRFRPDSELNQVNNSAGRLVSVSRLFAHTLRVALHVAGETHGIVDPTLGSALEAAGYTRDFKLLAPDPNPARAPDRGAWRSVLLQGRLVEFPGSIQLDLNGVVKSLAVDDALALLSGDGFVSAGGDLAVRGELIVALPDGEAVLLRRGALATSGNTKRRWLRSGRVQHHLIDPRTGRPAESPWTQVTACGASCLAADVAAKAGFLLGTRGPDWLDERSIPARFLMQREEAIPNSAWRRSMDEAVACT
jgi:thiamine biosynthesis lipoprotein